MLPNTPSKQNKKSGIECAETKKKQTKAEQKKGQKKRRGKKKQQAQ